MSTRRPRAVPPLEDYTEHTPAIHLDWVAYFREFDGLHGGDAVEHAGRLLWRDGWTHSATDHSGPEWPPPQDPERLRMLQVAYWSTRRRAVADEVKRLTVERDHLAMAQASKSAPLQMKVIVADSETGHLKMQTQPLDLAVLTAKIDWLNADVRDCDEQLEQLRDAHQQQV